MRRIASLVQVQKNSQNTDCRLVRCNQSFVRVIEQGEGAEGRKILRTIRVGPDQGAIGHLVQHISVSDQQDEFLARDR
jgi:hypothetical protein